MLSIVVPVHNEAENIQNVYIDLAPVVDAICGDRYEIIYVDDGSTDRTAARIESLHEANSRVKLLSLSRNFGKEMALAAGIAHASGRAVLTMDGDGQHPPDRIPDFVAAWRSGAQVVIGVRTANKDEGIIKKYGSWLFYMLFNRLSGAKMVPGSSDFRLIDREVQQEFIKLREPQTITRGLIDWLGFKRAYITYSARPRTAGQATYKVRKLFALAAHSFVSLSPTPLYVFGSLGLLITALSFLLGLFVLIEQILLGDPLGLDFTGTAMLSILMLFLIGIVLVSQGVLALYISYIHTQAKGRQLFIVNRAASRGIREGNR